MLSIPEIATQLVDESIAQSNEDGGCTLFLVGSKSVGKSTVINSFLEKPDNPKETLVLEYSFGRKSIQGQGMEKSICHVWEYGGKLDLLKTVLTSLPIQGKFYYCVMVDLSKIKNIWTTMETCIGAMTETYAMSSSQMPKLILLCGKYDLFNNYDSEIKKFICTTIRSVALLHNAHLLFYSSKEQQLVKRAKDLFYGVGFGSGEPSKEKNFNYMKPLIIPRSTDSWENIGLAKSTLEQIKSRHIGKIGSSSEIVSATEASSMYRAHPEPVLDTLIRMKYKELSNKDALDLSIDDYLASIL